MLASLDSARAAPNEAKRLVTLPLTKVESTTPGLHPQLRLQQHINRSVRRLAQMKRREAPSSRDLEDRLYRRVISLEGDEGSLERRFNRIGVPRRTEARSSHTLEKRFNRHGVHRTTSKKPAAAGNNLAANNLKKKKPSQAGAAAPVADVTTANQPSDSDSLGLDIEAQDVGYLAKVQLGTPPRDFEILMDSGSADFWVGAENCQSQAGGGCGNHIFLGPQSSSSFVDTKAPFQVTYGTGQVSGDIITDNVSIAGLSLPAHTFGVATTESVDFSSDQTPFDGLMGLAKSQLSEQQTLTPPESLAKAGLITDPIVSFKISRLADDKNDGEITFGGLDTTKFDQNTLVTLPNVNPDGFWEAALDASSVDGTDTGLKGRTTILDTGTTLMVVPAADATAIHNLIQGAKSDGQGGFTVPCTTTASVALTFNGQAFAIDPRDIAFQPVDPNDPQGDCVSGIAAGDVGGATEWLVGDTFLKNAYFSTDVSTNTVSLAKLI
ncbi:aspartic peptidase A1 [Panaeolus papilionaceus]|nr:aspartic peptidase A1 [Panaeolus papilionaceus]